MNEKNLNKQQVKAIKSRKKLLEAAGELFSKNLIENVGVREISAKAGVTTGTFYHYFDGKDDILDQLYMDRDAEFGDLLENLKDTTPYVEGIIGFFSDTMASIILNDGVDFTMHRMFKMQKKSTENSYLYKGLTSVIKSAQEAGELSSEITAKELNSWLWVMFRGTVYDWCLDDDKDRCSLNDRLERAMKLLLKGYIRHD